MSKSPARHRASLFRPLAAQVAAVLLITIAAVAGLAAPSSADDQTAEPGQTPAGEQTPGPDPAPETDSPARSDQAPEPDQTSDQATGQAPEQTAPAAPEPQDDLPASKPAPEKQAPKSEGPESEAPETNTPKKQEKSPAPTTRETTSLAPTGSTDKKVWICKYSSTPDDNERAQTVNSVAYNNNREPGTWGFEDAQGLTYVYAFDTGAASKPSKDDCPILVAPPTSPTWTDPTCANPMGSYQLAAYEETRATVSTSGSLEPGGTFTVTYTAIPPHQFINGNSSPTTTMSFSHTFPDLVGCPVVIKDLPTVTVDDPCGTADDSVTLSTSSQYTGKDNGDGTATFTAVPPNVFPGNESTYTVHYTPTTNEPCTVIINPATPQVSESTACDTPWQISIADTDHVTYAISPASSGTEATTVTITATPDAYFAFGATPGWTVNPDGTATFEHSFAAATSCLDVPAAPAPEAPTCFDDGWVLVPVPDHTTVTVNGDPVTSATVFGPGTYDVVYTAANGYVFTSGGNESTTKTYDDITVAAATGDCVIPAPAQPDSIDVCNPATVINNVEWKQPFPDLDNIAWSIDASTGDAVATAINGMAFADNTTTRRFTLPADNGIECTAPVAPTVTQSSACDIQGTLTIPDTPGIVYALDGDTIDAGTHDGPLSGTLTATAKTGFENTDPTWSFQVDIPAATKCLEVPAEPTPTAPTCFDDGVVTVTVPAHVTVTVNGGEIIEDTEYGPGTYDVVYTATNGYVFTSGGTESTTKTYDDITVAAATGDCVIPAPAQPDSIDVCNPATVINNVEWKQPFPDLDNIAWSIDASTGDAVATAINGMAFADNTTTRRFTLPADNGIECTAPVAPTVTQSKACDIQSTLTIPDTPGIVYALDGDTIDAGTYDGPLSGTLTATAKTGFENTDPTWSFQVDLPTATACLEIPAQPDSIDPCNPETTDENVTWGTFPVLDDVEWSVDDTTGEAVATAINGRAFEGNLTEIRFSLPDDDGVACEMLPGDIESVCVDHIPYLRYAVGLPDDYVGPRDLTITFVNPDGADYVVADQPLAGRLLWPGASVNPPGWPGWVRNADGSYSKTSGNYAWTRDGVTVRFKVNPEYAVTVAYPQSTTACANPPQGPKADGPEPEARPETPNGVLPNTGAPANAGLAAMVGGLWLVLGAWLMLHTRRRHG